MSPAAVLAAAQPIEAMEARLVQVQGDAGTVDIRYRVGGSIVYGTLDAERVDGEWRLLTSLAERVLVEAQAPGAELTIAGVSIADRAVQLYPGRYPVETTRGPVIETSAAPFVVDGDQGTPTYVFATPQLVPELRSLAGDYGVAAAAACQSTASCRLPQDALLGSTDQVYLQWSDLQRGTLDIGVPVIATVWGSQEWFEVQVRLHVDAEGHPIAWECGVPGQNPQPGDLQPCPPLG
jgi:hypothetical protein